MATLLSCLDDAAGTSYRQATIRLDNGEACIVSLRQGGVRIKKIRFGGLGGATLFAECNSINVVRLAAILATHFPTRKLPQPLRDANLDAFANALMNCTSCNDVRDQFRQIRNLSAGSWPPPPWWQPRSADRASQTHHA